MAPSILFVAVFEITTVCPILYASPVDTVNVLLPVPIAREVAEEVEYLSPFIPPVP
jgi:hypothetical protein